MSSLRNQRLRAIIQTICRSIRKVLIQNGVSGKEMPDSKICAAIRHALTVPLDDEVRISRPVVKFEMFPETIACTEFKVTIAITQLFHDGYFRFGQARNCKRKKYLEKQLTELFENIPKLRALRRIVIDIDMSPLQDVLLNQPILHKSREKLIRKNVEKCELFQYKPASKCIILMADLMEGSALS